MQEIHRKVRADEAVTDAEWAAWKAWRGIGSSSSGGRKRKRKKRRKRKLPKSGCRLFPPGGGRPCDHASDPVHPQTLVLPVVAQRQVPTVHASQLLVQFLDTVLDMPGVLLRQVPDSMVQKTVVVPQLQFIVVRRHPFRAADADSHGPDYSADHRVSTVAVLSWWSTFLFAVVHILRCCLCEDSRDPKVAARARICPYGLRLCFHSPWFWCSCVCVRIRRYGLRLCFRSPWFWCSCVCVRLRRRGQGLRSCSPSFGARVHSCRGAETAPLVCLFS